MAITFECIFTIAAAASLPQLIGFQSFAVTIILIDTLEVGSQLIDSEGP